MTPRPHVGPVNGFYVVPTDSLAGAKCARRSGNTLYVSPAMWHLLETAEDREEFAAILKAIPVVVVPPPGYVAPMYAAIYPLRSQPHGPRT